MSEVIPIKPKESAPSPTGSRTVSFRITRAEWHRLNTLLRQIKKKTPKATRAGIVMDLAFNGGFLTKKQKSYLIGREWIAPPEPVPARIYQWPKQAPND